MNERTEEWVRSRCGAQTWTAAVPTQPSRLPLHASPRGRFPKERARNPAQRQSLGSASPPPAQPQRPDPPHLVSKYTLGGCQESGGIAAIAMPAELFSSNGYFRRRFARDLKLQRTLPAPAVQLAKAWGVEKRRTPPARPRSYGARRKQAGRKAGEKCKLH